MSARLTPSSCRARRLALGLSYGKLARLAYVEGGAIRSYETGRMDKDALWRGWVEAALMKAEAERNK